MTFTQSRPARRQSFRKPVSADAATSAVEKLREQVQVVAARARSRGATAPETLRELDELTQTLHAAGR